MKIGPYTVGEKPIKIAECGINHGGSLPMALKMIDIAAECGVEIVKFQTFKADEFCRKDDPLYPVFKECELPTKAWPLLARRCRERGVLFMSTPQNYSDLELLLPLGVPAIKVGSDDCANYDLLERYASHGIPLIVSLGMSDIHSIAAAINLLRDKDVVYLVCTSQYPCPPEEARVARITSLSKFGVPVGYSDHTQGNEAVCLAVAYGATAFEKHFTLSHEFDGPDHRWACEPDELKSWCQAIEKSWIMRGDGSLNLTPREEEQRVKYQRKSGQRLRGENVID